MNIYVLAGLPGSGKTYKGKEISSQLRIPFIDDCLLDINTWNKVELCIIEQQDLIIASSQFVLDEARSSLEDKIRDLTEDFNIEYLFFTNEPEVCKVNKEINENYLDFLSRNYNAVDNIIPCYKES